MAHAPDKRPEIHTLTVPAALDGARLDRALATLLPQISRSRLKALIESGQAHTSAGALTSPSGKVKAGMALRLEVPAAVAAIPQGEAIPLEILFEDPHLLVVNKPAGLTVHPAPGNQTGTLVNAVIAHCGADLSGIGGVERPGIVHRLDKDTSGIMVVAKTQAAHQGLTTLFSTRDIGRHYLALVWGLPSPAKGQVEGAIGRHPQNRKKMAVVTRGGKAALTHYQLQQAFAGTAVSLLACRLATGRTHQIRVHLAHLGHPLLGDPLYGRAEETRMKKLFGPTPRPHFRRQALHAASLAFVHPITGAKLSFEAPPPQDMKDLIAALESL